MLGKVLVHATLPLVKGVAIVYDVTGEPVLDEVCSQRLDREVGRRGCAVGGGMAGGGQNGQGDLDGVPRESAGLRGMETAGEGRVREARRCRGTARSMFQGCSGR